MTIFCRNLGVSRDKRGCRLADGGALTLPSDTGTPSRPSVVIPSFLVATASRVGIAVRISLGLMVFAAGGCANRISAEDQEISMRQVDLAASLRVEGNVPSALEHLRTALEHDPDNVEAYLLLAYIQASRSDFASAEGNAQRGVRLLVAQERSGARLAEARNLLGGILMNLARFDEAIVILHQSAVDAYNQAPHQAWYNLALAQSGAGLTTDALTSLEEAIRLRSTFCDGYYGMGQLLSQLERYAEAEQALTRALTAEAACGSAPTLQGAWRLRGEARRRLGNPGDATADFERCIELGPETDEGARCQAVLDNGPS
jgi:tetratricopeptide (TPR) repeat protein